MTDTMLTITPQKLGKAFQNFQKATLTASVSTLTRIAAGARRDMVTRVLPSTFTLRNKHIVSRTRWEKATFENKESEVYTTAKYLDLHETGATIRFSGTKLGVGKWVVPTEYFFTIYNKKKVIPKHARPENILKKVVKGHRPFLVREGSGGVINTEWGRAIQTSKIQPGIWVKSGGGIRPLYLQTKSAKKIDKRPFWEKATVAYYQQNFNKFYSEQVSKQVKKYLSRL